MKVLRTFTVITTVVCGLLLNTGTAAADDISGTITTTWTIYENSRLVGDVTCVVVNAPCISVGASHITLRLNGYTMKGRANPPADCVVPDPTLVGFLPEDGITTNNQSHVAILGPGLVEKFGRYGVIVGEFPQVSATQGSNVTVKNVVSHHNCFSGIQLAFVSDNVIEENVSVRNSSASGAFACGGTCILQSDNNRIRRNEYSGNGSVAPPNNDFGVGLLAGSDRNVIEENSLSGNTNGVWIAATAGIGNVVRRNIIAGNPPVQLGATGGVDIRHNPPSGMAFEDNLCITYQGTAAPPPCPYIPKFAISHHPQSRGGDDK
jgi:parallel beta-helix repeat protein